jgi:hypothetical protein
MTQASPVHRDAPPAQEVRVSTLDGDRPCIRCGFNLQGQPVLREPVYGMIIVRCPECSTIASLQEYPMLGKWANRLAALIAAIWLIVLLGGIAASSGITFGLTESAIQTGSEKLATAIAAKYAAWYEAADETTKKSVSARFGQQAPQVNSYTWVDSTWWSKQDPRSFVSGFGGIRYAIDRKIVDNLTWSALVGFLLGVFWSVLLLGLRRPRLLIFAFLIVGLAAAFEFIWGSASQNAFYRYSGGGMEWVRNLASHMLAPWVAGVALATSVVGLWIGLWTGRPIARWLIKLLLPPRLWAPLSFLWLSEGKLPPKPRTR